MNELPSFKFNGISSEDLGIIVKEMPPISKSERNIETVSVTGRNGNLHIDNGTYKSKNYKIVCILMDVSKIRQISSIFNGFGKLELSTEPNLEYQAMICNQIDFSKYLTYLKEFVLQFEVDPIAYDKNITETTYTESSDFTVGGTIEVHPILTINGTGIVTLNNKQIEVLETGIIIDCELMNCTKDNINMNDKVIIDNDFPNLVVGENNLVLGDGIESVTISYKTGWL